MHAHAAHSPLSPARRLWLIASVVVYGALLTAYTLNWMPHNGRMGPRDFCVIALAAAWPILCNRLAGDGWLDGGLRSRPWHDGWRAVAIFTGLGAAAITVVGLAVGGFHWVDAKTLAEKSAVYLAWGPAQQYLLNTFGLRRLRQAGLPPAAAVALTACVFAAIHAPNWPLVGMTLLGGAGWAALFLRHPNVPLMGLSHGLLAVLLYHAWPDDWLQRMTIGQMYLHRLSR
jgi:hypothetical protein